ncbi:hypothetical protein, conserved [Plasmodium gonderi]|uniref:Uncharacterized protein n=1 Tax=Plasmodium gonderi TaxID=77519 RepID=A0A1Y1JKW4_PLAGO|nr:hypothetical protein, conserved [Plasmodium gonderi]GAW83166.1 hypothetical protein, conserved [Plasmodium gonderi]
MRRAQTIFAFYFLLIFCYLLKLSTVNVFCEIINGEDVYLSTLRNQNFSEEFIKLFENKDVRITIEKFITEEQVKYYISRTRKSDHNIIKTVEKLLLREFPSTIGTKENIIKNELLKFLSIILTKQEDVVKSFFSNFSKNSLDIGVKYRHFENRFLDEYENIEKLKKLYFATFNQVSEALESTKTSEDNKSSVYFIDIKDIIFSNIESLKETLAKLRSEVVALYNINYELNEFKNDVDSYISNYRSSQRDEANVINGDDPQGDKENDVIMLKLVDDVSSKLMFSLRTKISSTRDELQKRLVALEKELIDLSNEITRLEIQQNVPKLAIVKNNNFLNIDSIRNEYEEYVRKANLSLNINQNYTDEEEKDNDSEDKDEEKNEIGSTYKNKNKKGKESEGDVFEKTLLLLERHSKWVKEQDAFTYCERNDIAEVLEICLNLVEKLKDLVVHENFNLLMKYENLYKELNKFLYHSKSSIMDVSYIKAWHAIENYKGTEILIHGVDRLLNMISVLTQMINIFKDVNKNMNPDVFFDLNRLSNGFLNASKKVTLFKVELAKLMHPSRSLQIIKNNIEKFGHVYKDKITEMKVIINSFGIASDNMQTEIDELLKTVSDIIQADNLINEFKKVRNVWKRYVKHTLKNMNVKKSQLIKAYGENKNVIFPPEMTLSGFQQTNEGDHIGANGGMDDTDASEYISFNRNIFASDYFTKLQSIVINKFDSLNNEMEMKKLFSVIYRSIDIIIYIIKDNRKQMKIKYNKKRNDIINLINYRKDVRIEMSHVYDKLVELEGDLVNNLQKLFINKVNLNQQIEHSVKKTKDEYFKDKAPLHCKLVEEFITKYFLTITRWKNFINRNRKYFPPTLIWNDENS